MDDQELAGRIDHTVLGPETTLADVERLLDEAADYGTNACVPPCYVGEAREYAPTTTLATVRSTPDSWTCVASCSSPSTHALNSAVIGHGLYRVEFIPSPVGVG